MAELTKKLKKLLAQWNRIAYERELNSEIAKLHQSFESWKSGKLDPFELSDIVHTFSTKTARDLFSRYEQGVTREWFVVRALKLDLLKRDEMPAELLEFLEPWMKLQPESTKQ